MKLFPHLKHEDTQKLVLGAVLIIAVSIGARYISQTVAILACLIAAFLIGSLFLMHYFREAMHQQNRLSEHIQDLNYLQSQLKLKKPLPYMTGWSASPALASRLHSLIRDRRPSSILELGSGVSTLVMAYAVDELGSGSIISIDHDEVYAEKTRAELRRHGLDHVATVVYAPLVQVGLNGGKQPWYDLSKINQLEAVDLLIVDGPPRATCKDARLPAFDYLTSRLSPGCAVVIDDANRICEQRSVAAWSSISVADLNEDIPSEKGVCVRFVN